MSLRKARDRRDEAHRLLADGIDPGEKRKAEAAADAESFEAVAREWFARQSVRWAPGHANKIIRRLERDVFPWIGSKPIAGLTAPDILAVLRRIESRGSVETAHRAHQSCGQTCLVAPGASAPMQRTRHDFAGMHGRRPHSWSAADRRAAECRLNAHRGYLSYPQA